MRRIRVESRASATRGRARRSASGSSSGLFVGPLNVAIDIGLDFRVCRANNYAAARRRPRSITSSPRSPCAAGARARRQKSTPSCKGHSFSAKSLRYDDAEHDARRPARRQPPLRARQRARADAPALHKRGAASACRRPMTDRRGGKADEIPVRAAALRRRGVRRAGPHRGRGLARVPRRASGAFVAEPPARARSEARGTPRLGWHAWTPRLAQPRAPRGRLLPSCSASARPPRNTGIKTQVPPQGRQEDLRQPTPDAHQGPGFELVKQVRRHQRRNTPPGAGSYFRRRRRRVFDWINNVAKWTSDGPEREDEVQQVLRHYRRNHTSLETLSAPLPLGDTSEQLQQALSEATYAPYQTRVDAFQKAMDSTRVSWEVGRVELRIRRHHCLVDAAKPSKTYRPTGAGALVRDFCQ